MLIQEERVKTIARGKDDRAEVTALAVQGRNHGDGKERVGVCSHCKRMGHDSDNCFAFIGYPEW